MRRRRARSLEALFVAANCQGRKVVTHAELTRAGVSKRKLDTAVRSGRLRCGVSGCWKPEAMDPGARAVMCRAMKDRGYALGRRR